MDLASANRGAWIVVGLVTAATGFLLFGIVAGGGRTIARQRLSLERRVTDLARLAEQNQVLRMRAEGAAGRAAELNERYLRRLSSDLHDGPTQMLALAALRLDEVERQAAPGAGSEAIGAIRGAVGGAIQEIRHLCRGLAAPELARLPIGDVIELAVDGHRQRTSSTVETAIDLADMQLPHPHSICVYRFIQEALSNAYRHAGGVGQLVSVRLNGDRLCVAVSDRGPGLPSEAEPGTEAGLGIAGLKDRVESLGGTFRIHSAPGAGTQICMELEILEGEWR